MGSENKVFKEIALSLSGGGYRAAAFHLGTITMLEELKLLSDVKILSTVSGGTITGVAFANSLAEGLSFDDFYQRLYNFLQNNNVIKIALCHLSESTQINQLNNMPSLIRAAAQVYSSDAFLGNKTFDFLSNESCSQLKEVAFNATDFRTGNSFRFQKSESSQVRSGNNQAQIKPEINNLIRLADIVAASSCFPSGFEPIRFPSDFVWLGKELNDVRQQLGEIFKYDIPLMDGGVFDNQGIDSIENIYKRKNNEIALYIISDTDQRNTNLFSFPPQEKKGWLSLKLLYGLTWLIFIGSIFTVGTIITEFIASYKNNQLSINRVVFLYLIPFVFSLLVALAIGWGRRYAIKMQALVKEKTGFELWKYIKNLAVPEVIELIDSRLKSLIIMSSSVFMKRIRALGFDRLFSDLTLQNKLIPNLIYDLDNESRWGQQIVEQNLQPSKNLREVAVKAERYSTNLWFLHQEDLDNLILCGRATICFKVLKYLLKYKLTEISIIGSPEADLFNKTRNAWIILNK